MAVFLAVARSTRHARDVDPAASSRLRKTFFVSLSAGLAVFLFLSLARMPYPAEGGTVDRVVHVAGKQYAFALTDVPVTSAEAWDQGAAPSAIDVPAGSTVEFRVTTLDVNHGFSLYAPDGELMAQTQAMPGYVNRIRVRFDRPGPYTVLCLEYCGMGHHRMRGVIEVK